MSGPLFIEALAENGLIDSNKFSFYFQEASSDSWIDLGEPDLGNLKNDTSLVETQMIEKDFFWSFFNTGVAIGTIDNAFVYEEVPDMEVNIFQGNSFYSIIDTGSTALVISVLYYESLIQNIFDYAMVTDWSY